MSKSNLRALAAHMAIRSNNDNNGATANGTANTSNAMKSQRSSNCGFDKRTARNRPKLPIFAVVEMSMAVLLLCRQIHVTGSLSFRENF